MHHEATRFTEEVLNLTKLVFLSKLTFAKLCLICCSHYIQNKHLWCLLHVNVCLLVWYLDLIFSLIFPFQEIKYLNKMQIMEFCYYLLLAKETNFYGSQFHLYVNVSLLQEIFKNHTSCWTSDPAEGFFLLILRCKPLGVQLL